MLQTAFEEALMEVPHRVAASKIAAKFADEGVELTHNEIERLVQYLQSKTTDVFRFRRWRWWESRQITITLTESDVQEIHDRFTEFLNSRLPDLILSTTEEISTSLLSALHRTWRSQSKRQNHERNQFEKRLHEVWGQAIDRLRMCLTVGRELGESVSRSLRSKTELSSTNLVDVLTRLHARACQVVDEIVCLLSAGFSDGAMARWRTLHEIAAVAFLLKEYGDQLAVRYVEHQVIESFRAASDYRHCYERLGYEPMEDSEYEEIRRARDKLIQRYGKQFDSQYGWAASALCKRRPTLRDIEEAAGIDQLRAHYRMASHNVHANPKGVFFKLGLIDEKDVLLAGPSNVGLADPGHSASISLMQVTTALCLLEPNMDTLVGQRILVRLVDEVGDLFQKAHGKLLEGAG